MTTPRPQSTKRAGLRRQRVLIHQAPQYYGQWYCARSQLTHFLRLIRYKGWKSCSTEKITLEKCNEVGWPIASLRTRTHLQHVKLTRLSNSTSTPSSKSHMTPRCDKHFNVLFSILEFLGLSLILWCLLSVYPLWRFEVLLRTRTSKNLLWRWLIALHQ